MHFLYVFILQFLYHSTFFEKTNFIRHQEFMIYCTCSSVQTMQTCLTARSYDWDWSHVVDLRHVKDP